VPPVAKSAQQDTDCALTAVEDNGDALERWLQIAEERLDLIAVGANLGMWDWNPETDDIWYNEHLFAMLGYEPGEHGTSVRALRELIHPEDLSAARTALIEHLHGRTIEYKAELRMRCKDGSWRWMLHRARVITRTEAGRVTRLVGVQVDFTHRRELQMQLSAAQRLEAVGQLAAGIAHEINTPAQYVSDSVFFVRDALATLLPLTQKLREGVSLAPADIEELDFAVANLPEALERATEGLTRVTEIVRAMKDFSHPDSSQKAPVDINHALTTTLTVARNEWRHVADIHTELGDVPMVMCHGGEINQVLLNLIVNAAHAIGDVPESGKAKGQIILRSRQENDEVVITVTDTGTGIPEAAQSRVFDPYFTTKPVGKGTGQGLSICRNIIVKRHGGKLTFDTRPGEGTTFTIRLPVFGSSAPPPLDEA
jgi:PAS domain S-box-containing protein